MTDIRRYTKIIILFFAAIGLTFFVVFMIWSESNKIRPAMSEEELWMFEKYHMFDGNLHCLNRETYLGTAESDRDEYPMKVLHQYYKIEGLDISELILSHNKEQVWLKVDTALEASYVIGSPETTNSLFGWDIKSIEIYNGRSTAESTEALKTQSIVDQLKIEAFIDSVKANYDADIDFIDQELINYLSAADSRHLEVQINFLKNENIIWLASVLVDDRDGQVYLCILKPDPTDQGLRPAECWIPVELPIDTSLF